MISVLQILLKILGIILLSLLGIIIVSLLVMLFVPVRYRFKGYYKDDFCCHGKITWLLHLISISVDFDKQLVTSIKIFGIPLSAFQKKKAKEEAKVQELSVDEASANETEEDNKSSLIDKKDADNKPEAKPAIVEEADSCKEDVTQDSDSMDRLSGIEKFKRKFTDLTGKIRKFLNKIRDIIINIRTKKETAHHYISILQREEVKKAFSLCKKRIWLLIKHILPKKMKVEADFGFDDPAITGYILAVHGILPISLGKKIILHPDFDKQMFSCDFYIKGAVNAWSMLHQLLCIISDKNCRALYHIVKKEILNERK